MAGGGQDTDRHYYETIKTKRTIDEIAKFLSSEEIKKLKAYSHNRPYAVWGAVPGTSNIRNWNSMERGDYVMVYRKGKIILAAEIAMKVRNADLGRYFWQENEDNNTWEYIYFMINEVEFNVPMSKLNKYLSYEENYHPQGFMAIKQEKVNEVLSNYGDLISLLQKLDKGEKIEEISPEKKKEYKEILEEKIKRAPTVHDEMQWRLIRLGNKSNLDVWVPIADQNREYDGQKFKNFVIKEFHETLDVPVYVKNIDTVWKLGYSIKSAFEIEHSTSIYSGILRLSDLRSLAPNSNYPLFIVADRDRKNKVFDQLKRPTFSNDYLNLDKVVKFLSYDSVREYDEKTEKEGVKFNINSLIAKSEMVG